MFKLKEIFLILNCCLNEEIKSLSTPTAINKKYIFKVLAVQNPAIQIKTPSLFISSVCQWWQLDILLCCVLVLWPVPV